MTNHDAEIESNARTFRNPLHDYVPTVIANWDEFLAQWRESTSFELRLSLLHCGFDLPYERRNELFGARAVFYLQVADGHMFTHELDEDPRDTSYYGLSRSRVVEIRQQLARKALAMLVQHFFSYGSGERVDDREFRLLFSEYPDLVDAVMWFFRPNQFDKSRNSRPDNRVQQDVIKSFIKRFYRSIWRWVEINGPNSLYWESSNQDLYYHLLELRPQLLRLMDECGELDLLQADDFTPDEACLALLRQQVFGEEYRFGDGETRAPTSLEEAMWAGSRIAPLLIILDKKMAEAERQRGFRELTQRRLELEEQEEALRQGRSGSANAVG